MLDRAVDQMVFTLKDDPELIAQIFKTVSAKMVHLVLKDTQACVRDSAI